MKKIVLFIALAHSLIISPVTAASKHTEELKLGEHVYKNHCAVCHLSGAAQAPKVHDVERWKTRYEVAEKHVTKCHPNLDPKQLKELTMEQMLDVTIEGVGFMPSRGGCPEDKCSDKDLMAAIKFMMNPKPETGN